MIPTEARRQNLNQENPCSGDMIVFTCTLNDTTGLRWSGNGIILYTYFIPVDIGRDQTGIPGLISSLVNNTTSTLSVNLSDTTSIINGTEVGCSDGGSTNLIETMIIIGNKICYSQGTETVLIIHSYRPCFSSYIDSTSRESFDICC